MIRHIVMWSFAAGFTPEENLANAKKAKADLEALAEVVPGVVSLNVVIEPLGSSNRDVMLDSLFESEEALQEYQKHPDHVKAGTFIKSVFCDRACVDFVE